ncbi:hypothetical protein BDZ45DRAFT_380427 [Acephala macrosclerotiorum]|nr:hypothetical protein BDZ45DRAFT_380427 [Acephala macrosclerotiorum]
MGENFLFEIYNRQDGLLDQEVEMTDSKHSENDAWKPRPSTDALSSTLREVANGHNQSRALRKGRKYSNSFHLSTRIEDQNLDMFPQAMQDRMGGPDFPSVEKLKNVVKGQNNGPPRYSQRLLSQRPRVNTFSSSRMGTVSSRPDTRRPSNNARFSDYHLEVPHNANSSANSAASFYNRKDQKFARKGRGHTSESTGIFHKTREEFGEDSSADGPSMQHSPSVEASSSIGATSSDLATTFSDGFTDARSSHLASGSTIDQEILEDSYDFSLWDCSNSITINI